MDTQQAACKETLMEARMEAGEGSHVQHPHCSSWVVALMAVMGLVILGLVTGFILFAVIFMPSCEKEVPALPSATKVYQSSKLKETNETGRFDIFKVDKSATYLIYGWVKLSMVSEEELVLTQNDGENKSQIIEIKIPQSTEIFFYHQRLMADGFTISIYCKSHHTDSLFHLYEL